MEIAPILKGSSVGVFVGLLLAALLAVVRYYTDLNGVLFSALFWAAAVVLFLAAGMVAGRSSDQLHWIHGALAALTLNLVGNVLADLIGHGDLHFWLDLGMATTMGLWGGIWGATLLP